MNTVSSRKTITANGHEYRSLAAFCREYNYNYNSAYKLFIDGKNGDEIIKAFQNKKAKKEAAEKTRERVIASSPSSERKNKKKPITAEGRIFQSLLAFSNYYGFKYSSVVARVNKGYTGDEILASLGIMSQSRPYQPYIGTAHACTFEGIDYPSIVSAADAVGVEPTDVYHIMKTYDLSPDKAIRKALDEKIAKDTAPVEPTAWSCVIAGKTYRNKAEAVKVYGTKMSTVESRMQRKGISFEEALLLGHRERKQMIGENSRYIDLNISELIRTKNTAKLEMDSVVSDITEVLKNNNYTPEIYEIKNIPNMVAIKFEESLFPISDKRNLYLFLTTDKTSQQIEIVLPDLITFPQESQILLALLLEKINELNRRYVSGKVYVRNGSVTCSWSFPIVSKTLNSRLLLKNIYSFIGTSSKFYEELVGFKK